MSENYSMDHLRLLEAESIHIFREVAAESTKPVLLYSIGKDSSVLLKLAEKAFAPRKIPFPLLHIDTGYKFPEMIEFRDYYTKKLGVNLIVHKNESEDAKRFGPEHAHTEEYIYHKKTKALLDAIAKYGFDTAIGGARREEEKSRAKERIFSVRGEGSVWDPKNQRPELWHAYNTLLAPGQSMRVFPLSNWTEADIWEYIKQEQIEIVPLYFSKKRKVVKRHGILVRVDDYTQPKEGEEVMDMFCRYRTLGCAPSTGAVPSTATTFDEIIYEVITARKSERENRAIDKNSDSGMEQKKKEGYF